MLTILAQMPGSADAADPGWIEPIEAAFARLDKKLHNFTAIAKVFMKDELVGQPPGERKLAKTFEVSRVGNYIMTVRLQREDDMKTYAAVNDDYFFLLHEDSTGERSLSDVGERTQFNLANAFRRVAPRQICDDATWIMGVFGFPLESPTAILKHNANHLHTKEVEEGGRKLFVLEGDFTRYLNASGLPEREAPLVTLRQSRIVLDPGLDFRIVRWESTRRFNGKDYVTVHSYEYNHEVDGYPVPSKYRFHSGTPSIGYTTMETEFSDWQLGVNTPARFRLPYYGLKEPNWSSKPLLSGWMWLLLVGAALVAVGTWLYRRSASHAR